MRTSALFVTKIPDFFEILCCVRTDKGRVVEPVRTFCWQGERGSIFRDFVWTSFMDSP